MASHPSDASCTIKGYASQSLSLDQKGASLTIAERSSKDGYNWRKYGEKLVKGSKFPRSYYKCTHPNCQVKKKLERSHNGLVTAMMYEGIHDHPKPQPSRRQSVGGSSIAQEGIDKAEVLPASTGRAFNQLEADRTPGPSFLSTSDDEGGEGTSAHGHKLEDEGDEGDPESKRRIMGSSPLDRITIRTTSDPRVVVQTMSEVDILDDGYRWRKYGQKVVKGNPNPRSYYKCTNAGCPVRKHVERAYHDPKSVITTYEGKHNHDVPTASATRHEISMHMAVQSVSTLNGGSPVALSLVMLKPPNHIENGRAPLFPTASNVVSQDLGAGIGQLPESRCITKQNLTETEDMDENIRGANLTNS